MSVCPSCGYCPCCGYRHNTFPYQQPSYYSPPYTFGTNTLGQAVGVATLGNVTQCGTGLQGDLQMNCNAASAQ